MKIGFFGDGPWAERALLPLVQDSRYTIVFVAVRASRPDQKLIEMATKPWHPAALSGIGQFRREPCRDRPDSAPICMFRCRTTRFFARRF